MTLVFAKADIPLKFSKIALFTIIFYHSKNRIREGHSVVHCFVTAMLSSCEAVVRLDYQIQPHY